MMGHNKPEYQGWIERAGYQPVKQVMTGRAEVHRLFFSRVLHRQWLIPAIDNSRGTAEHYCYQERTSELHSETPIS